MSPQKTNKPAPNKTAGEPPGAAVKEGWQTRKLGDMCSIASVLVDPRMMQYEDMIHVGGANIESMTGALVDLKSAKEEGLKSGKFVFDETMVLYSKIRPYLMKVTLPDFRGLCSADIYPLSPDPRFLDRGYLFYQLLSPEFTEFAVSGSARAGMPKVNREHLFTFQFAVPPLPEQKRIVALLDEAFAGIATAKANAEKNLQNARAVFESHLQSTFTQGGEGWVEKTLAEVCHQITDGKHGDCQDQTDSGYYFLSAKDVKGGTLNYEGARQITKGDFEETHRRTRLEPGDILITNSGTIGRMAIAPLDERTTRTTFQKSVAILKLVPAVIDSRFAFYCLSSGIGRFVNLSAGAAQKNLLLRDLKSYCFSLPRAIDQQRAVGNKLDELRSETQRLASIYEKKIAALDALKKALLRQAFSGEL